LADESIRQDAAHAGLLRLRQAVLARNVARDWLHLPATWLPPGLEPAEVMDAPGPVFTAAQRHRELGG